MDLARKIRRCILIRLNRYFISPSVRAWPLRTPNGGFRCHRAGAAIATETSARLCAARRQPRRRRPTINESPGCRDEEALRAVATVPDTTRKQRCETRLTNSPLRYLPEDCRDPRRQPTLEYPRACSMSWSKMEECLLQNGLTVERYGTESVLT